MVRGLTLMPIRDASDSRDDLIGSQAQQKRPFALNVACVDQRTRRVAMVGCDFEERGSRSDHGRSPFDSGLWAYAQGERWDIG